MDLEAQMTDLKGELSRLNNQIGSFKFLDVSYLHEDEGAKPGMGGG